jgi:hypothetical protein
VSRSAHSARMLPIFRRDVLRTAFDGMGESSAADYDIRHIGMICQVHTRHGHRCARRRCRPMRLIMGR